MAHEVHTKEDYWPIILDWAREHNGLIPTLRKLTDMTDNGSTSTSWRMYNQLVEDGKLIKVDDRWAIADINLLCKENKE